MHEIRTLKQIHTKLNLCRRCHKCNPYVRSMLRTGKTKYDPSDPV
jgi:hypothetical protein